MDDMLRDHSFAEELEQLKTKEADDDDELREEGDSVAPMDALEMLKRVFQFKRFMGNENGEEGACVVNNKRGVVRRSGRGRGGIPPLLHRWVV